MMNRLTLVLSLLVTLSTVARAADNPDARPRVVVSTDFPPLDVIPGAIGKGPPERLSDPDDLQSMVRFLVHANEFRVEALIASAGSTANVARKKNLQQVLDVYARVAPNLRKHDPLFPTADQLRSVVREGLSGSYGKPADSIVGANLDTEASDFLADLVRRPDNAPIWFCSWGGSRELAQALWKLRSLDPASLPRAVERLRVYLIAEQDGTAAWLREQFPQMFIITARNVFPGIAYLAKGSDRQWGDEVWVRRNLRQGHGPLGAIYPECAWFPQHRGVLEGDTPSFLYLLSAIRGLSDSEHPDWGGWGGRFVQPNAGVPHWFDAPEGPQSVTRWQARFQNEFAARMDWTTKSPKTTNHPPRAMLNGITGAAVIPMVVKPGTQVELDASGSQDPDGDRLTYHYWQDILPGHTAALRFVETGTPRTQMTVPTAARGEAHVVLEVTDDGEPRLVAYRRVVVTITP